MILLLNLQSSALYLYLYLQLQLHLHLLLRLCLSLQSWLWHAGWPLATSSGALVLQLSDAEIAHALQPAELYLCVKLGKWVDNVITMEES